MSSAVEPLPSKQGGIERHGRNAVIVSQTRVPAFSYAEESEKPTRAASQNTVREEAGIGIIESHTDDMSITHTVVEHGFRYFKTTDDGFTVFDGSMKEVTTTNTIRKQHATLPSNEERKDRPQSCGSINAWAISAYGALVMDVGGVGSHF
ncbi:hypothetical protein B0J11DRAFT_508263 [Dendryphion nanum]|uniref:Uncharacterized protein n=1 Tax=Dendryphion nanum TaxID=256645 RepID=A0A9P9DL76_9PLEO|nr:hypothetical protein B0J11DRAFT_508263 [Dendryphion nanum]